MVSFIEQQVLNVRFLWHSLDFTHKIEITKSRRTYVGVPIMSFLKKECVSASSGLKTTRCSFCIILTKWGGKGLIGEPYWKVYLFQPPVSNSIFTVQIIFIKKSSAAQEKIRSP